MVGDSAAGHLVQPLYPASHFPTGEPGQCPGRARLSRCFVILAGGGALSRVPRISVSYEGVDEGPDAQVVALERRPWPSERVRGKGVVQGGAGLELLEEAIVTWCCVSCKSTAAGGGGRGKWEDFRSPYLLELWGVGGTARIAGEGEELEVVVSFRAENGGRARIELGDAAGH